MLVPVYHQKKVYIKLELAECLKIIMTFIYLIGNQINDPYCGKDISLFHNVSYLGQIIDRYKLAEYYLGAKIFIFPSEEDCSPNVILEAMACGLPILTVNSGGIPELINHGRHSAGLYLDENNPVMSLNTILKFYDKYSKDAEIIVKKNYDINFTAKKYIEEIKKLVQEKIMKIFLSRGKANLGSNRIYIENLSQYFSQIGLATVVSENILPNFDYYILSKYSNYKDLNKIRQINKNRRVICGIIHPSDLNYSGIQMLKGSDFAIVGSIEERDYYLRYKKNVFRFPQIENIDLIERNT